MFSSKNFRNFHSTAQCTAAVWKNEKFIAMQLFSSNQFRVKKITFTDFFYKKGGNGSKLRN